MNSNIVRIGLAAVAAFYVVVGGLWATSYFPLKKFYAQAEATSALMASGRENVFELQEYKDAEAYQEKYLMTHPSLITTENRLALYQAILFWGTIAMAAGGGVFFLTRREQAGTA